MKFETYPKQENSEKVQLIGMHPRTTHPFLCGLNMAGELISGGCIAEITPNGTLHLNAHCKVPGIQTDEDGRIIIE